LGEVRRDWRSKWGDRREETIERASGGRNQAFESSCLCCGGGRDVLGWGLDCEVLQRRIVSFFNIRYNSRGRDRIHESNERNKTNSSGSSKRKLHP
jgi:hypothetical protein